MGRKGKGGPGGLIGGVALLVIAAIVSVPPAIWGVAGVLLIGYLIHRLTKITSPSKASRHTAPWNSASPPLTTPPPVTPPAKGRPPEKPEDLYRADHVAPLIFAAPDEPVSVPSKVKTRESAFKIPRPLQNSQPARWLPPGESVDIAGLSLPGGMLYVGTGLQCVLGQADPSLIDPTLAVAAHGDYRTSEMGYWPSYSDISSTARRAYLSWLAGGRKDPNAEVGYVFLFFYGLERRVILDCARFPDLKKEWPAIANELRRLLAIYGTKSGSFERYANELLNWVSVVELQGMDLERETPYFPRTFELPISIRLALGNFALSGTPVPARLALSWAKLDPMVSLRTPAHRCPAQFELAFLHQYEKAHGKGLLLPKNQTKLKMVYRPASAGFRGMDLPNLTFGDTPDVSVLTGPRKTLQAVTDNATQEIEQYSRYVGRDACNRAKSDALEALLLLPTNYWPTKAQESLQTLQHRIGNGMVVMTFQDLLTALDTQSALPNEKMRLLAQVLAARDVSMEPDIVGGAKVPKAEERIVLFFQACATGTDQPTPAYQAARLTLELASAVASTDGEFSSQEMAYLRERVLTWSHLTPNHIQRLLAHLHLLVEAPVSLASLKKKLEPLDAAAKGAIAEFMATVAQSDGSVTPAEIKMLEKVYKALGVESKKVFSDVHAAAGDKLGVVPEVATAGLKLDPARIAALQQDTARVSALLAAIFTDAETPEVTTPAAIQEEDDSALDGSAALLGLDEAHSSFARLLLSRPHWARAELQDAASDLDLMLDGALERLNEAAFDSHDIPFTEGDDPVEVSPEILEKIEA